MSLSRRSTQSLTTYVPSLAYEGYTLFSPIVGCVAWLIDMQGRFVHNWETAGIPSGYGKLLPNGNLLYAAKTFELDLGFGGLGGLIVEYDWDGNVVWEHRDPFLHHDFERLPNGNTLVVKFVAVPDEMTAKVQGGISGTEANGVIWTDAIQEITPAGEVVWQWNAYEHLSTERHIICPLDERKEWTHMNTCHLLPNGDILTVFCSLHTIAIIDRKSGKLKWEWGHEHLGHPHDATMLENGNILVFDNGAHRKDNSKEGIRGKYSFSRVLEVNPATDKIEWEYRDESFFYFNTPFISGCQRLPNGNTLICEGTMGRFFEITPRKEICWEYISPFFNDSKPVGYGNAVFRAYRYSPDYPGLQGRKLDTSRYELTLRESPLWKMRQGKKKDKIESRLAGLGY